MTLLAINDYNLVHERVARLVSDPFGIAPNTNRATLSPLLLKLEFGAIPNTNLVHVHFYIRIMTIALPSQKFDVRRHGDELDDREFFDSFVAGDDESPEEDNNYAKHVHEPTQMGGKERKN